MKRALSGAFFAIVLAAGRSVCEIDGGKIRNVRYFPANACPPESSESTT